MASAVSAPFVRHKALLVAGGLAFAAWSFLGMGLASAEEPVKLPAPTLDTRTPASAGPQTAVFAGGCFWGVQGVFQHAKGVLNAVSGYAGGAADTASYERVSGGNTGHAEAVQITYDPAQITYGKLLQIYFSVAHDPTQVDRQGPDRGTQYRSAIFTNNPQQKKIAEAYIAQLGNAHAFNGKIATLISPETGFFPAESYHQDYLTLHPNSPYIARFDLPKIASLKKLMPDVYRENPLLVSEAAKVAQR
jgi:peptide-methionine (S)-S-oxide reductase